MASSLVVIKAFKIILFITFLCISLTYSDADSSFFSTLQSDEEIKSLKKRSLLTFPPDSLLQINMGITLTEKLEKNSAVVVLAFQQNAPLSSETVTLLAPSLVVRSRKFSIYNHLRDVIASYGFNGLECLKKMICQIGGFPAYGGLLEDLITFVLSPSKHRSIQYDDIGVETDWEKRNYMNSLLESEKLGKLGGNCTFAFPLCVRTPLDLISTFHI